MGRVSSLRYSAVITSHATGASVYTTFFIVLCGILDDNHYLSLRQGIPDTTNSTHLNHRAQVSAQMIVGVSLPVGSVISRTTHTLFILVTTLNIVWFYLSKY